MIWDIAVRHSRDVQHIASSPRRVESSPGLDTRRVLTVSPPPPAATHVADAPPLLLLRIPTLAYWSPTRTHLRPIRVLHPPRPTTLDGSSIPDAHASSPISPNRQIPRAPLARQTLPTSLAGNGISGSRVEVRA
ncbi:hypothetical protein C8R44DRAFT_876973 [Mycena epipterygia]|nr:hypothetical protein C8R44DRAFT_876973 [Mycena epipterygia]